MFGSTTLQECYQRARAVMQHLSAHNIKINEGKCQFFKTKIEYIGHNFAIEGVHPAKKKLKVILDAPEPTAPQQVERWVGMINKYHYVIPMMSTLIKPLYEAKGQEELEWRPQCQQAFVYSKKAIASQQVLVPFDPSKPIVLTTDSSTYRAGAVLSILVDGQEPPMQFASTKFNEAQELQSSKKRGIGQYFWCIKIL